LPVDGRDPRTEELLVSLRRPDGTELNIFATLARHPRLFKRWSAFGGTLLYRGTLPERERELLILRTGYLCRAHYEWGQHVNECPARLIDEGSCVAEGPPPRLVGGRRAPPGGRPERTPTAASAMQPGWPWRAVGQRQLIEVCMVVGQYHLVTLNSSGEPESNDLPAPA
jgi:hypothetical protein